MSQTKTLLAAFSLARSVPLYWHGQLHKYSFGHSLQHIVTRPLKEVFLASKTVILDYFSRELPFSRGEIDNSRLF